MELGFDGWQGRVERNLSAWSIDQEVPYGLPVCLPIGRRVADKAFVDVILVNVLKHASGRRAQRLAQLCGSIVERRQPYLWLCRYCSVENEDDAAL